MAPLLVPADFTKKLGALFEAGDKRGIESLALLFGDGQRITDAVVPRYMATETSVELTSDGEEWCCAWKQENPTKLLMAWAHSHHKLTLVPSVVDIKQQWVYQKETPTFVMVISNVAEGTAVLRLTDGAMASLSSAAGAAPEGVDTLTLVQRVRVSNGPPLSSLAVWEQEQPVKPVTMSRQTYNSLIARVQQLEDRSTEQERLLRLVKQELAELKDRTQCKRAFADVVSETDGESTAQASSALKRPRIASAFALFMKSISGELGGNAAARAKEASTRWRSLSADEKAPWHALAAEKKAAALQHVPL